MKKLFTITLYLFLTTSLYAEESKVNEGDTPNKDVSYPGEVGRDSEGTKIKRWSTEGPVKVAPAPQPFDNPSKQQLPQGAFINVNPNDVNRARSVGNSQ